MITHANVYHYVHAMRTRLEITELDRYLHTASIAFSSSVRQLMVPLTSGARVIVAKPDEIRQPLSLFATIRDQQVTVLDFIPSYWRICIEALAGTDAATRRELLENQVRLIATASESLLPDVPKRWRALGHRAQLINMFGQTETTGIVTTYTIPDGGDSRTKSVPIGYPIDGTQVYVLDEYHREVPAGYVGEIFVGGPGVGLGYVNQPKQTAERFVSDRSRFPSDGRLCATGDLGRLRADGSLEFVGRADDQIKIGGIRIELGEVESVLRMHPAVKDAAVVARGEDANNKRVIAFIVPARGTTLTVKAMRTFLSGTLPESMIPSAFVTVKSLPRLPNGKLDCKALPAPTHPGQALRSLVPPRNAAELKLARIWEGVLAVAAIGITDNFFDLGGNSLSGLYMLAQVGRAFGKQLPATAVLQAQTIEEMAKLLEEDPGSWSALVPLQTRGSRPPFFWIHGDKSDAFLPRYLGPTQPVYSLVHQSQDGQPAQFTTVEEIASHYLDEIRTVQPSGPYLIGGFCFGALAAFEIAHQLKAQGEEVRLLTLIEPSPLRNCGSSPIPHLGALGAKPFWGSRVLHSGLRHLRKVRRLGARDRAIYILGGVINRSFAFVNRLTSRPARIAKEAICWTYHRFGLPVPYQLRSAYILSVYRRARQKYTLRTYPGSVSLFVPTNGSDDSLSSWTGLASGTLEIHPIPEGHEAILVEPHVQAWAERLKVCLYRAQAPASQAVTTVEARL
jgi:aspartate racemase